MVSVDEVVHEAQQDRVADVSGEQPFEGRPVDARIVFAHVQLHEPFRTSFACPAFDCPARVDGAAIGDAGGLPSSHLRVEERLERHDGHMVVDLVSDRFAADDAVLVADRFDAVEVRDPRVSEAAFADFVGDPHGEPIEVWVGGEEAGDVAPGLFAFEVVADRGADERGGGAMGVLAVGFQSVSYLDYAGVPPLLEGFGYRPGARLDFRLGRGLPSHWLAWRVVVA